MKALKIIGGILVGLVLLVLILGLIAPSENHIERSVVIDAPAEMVRDHVNSFESMLKWSPWAERDPNQEVTIENDGQVGAIYTWSGEDSLVGAGSQEITAMNENEVVTHLHFMRPWESEADAKTVIEETEEGTKVTWSYADETPYPFNIMNLMIDMDAMLGPDFETGVQKLKTLVETAKAEKSEFDGFTIETAELSPRTYVGVRDTIGWSEMQTFFSNAFGTTYKKADKAGLNMVGMPSGVYFMWDAENQRADILAGVPVAEGSLEGMAQHTVGGKTLLINYFGPYEGSGKAHEAMEAYIKWHEVEPVGIAIEEYVTDPTTVEDPSKIHTKIYYPIN